MAYNQINSSNLFQPLRVNSNLKQYRMVNSERVYSQQDAYVDHTEPKLDCIFIFLPSTHSLTWLIIQREDRIIDGFS